MEYHLFHVIFRYIYTLLNVQIKVSTSIFSNVVMNTFKIISSSFFGGISLYNIVQ
jgi:hypothetical protein